MMYKHVGLYKIGTTYNPKYGSEKWWEMDADLLAKADEAWEWLLTNTEVSPIKLMDYANPPHGGRIWSFKQRNKGGIEKGLKLIVAVANELQGIKQHYTWKEKVQEALDWA